MAGSGRPESLANHSLIPLDRCLPGSPQEFGGLVYTGFRKSWNGKRR